MASVIEKLKSFLLIGLFVSALFMTQLILSEESYSNDALNTRQTKNANAIVVPQSYFVSFGGMSYTKVHNTLLQEKIWGELRPVLVSALKEPESVKIVDKETYIKAFSKKSILLRFPFAITTKDLFSVISEESGSLSVSGMRALEFLITEDANQMVYLYDSNAEAYYGIETIYPLHDVGGLLEAVKLTQFIEYRQISERYSLNRTVDETYNQTNYELIPYAYDLVVPSFKALKTSQTLEDQEDLVRSTISKEVFGNQMDFVKQLRDVNGSLILMYGYGEKTLTFTQEGEILFKSKYDANASRALSFKDAMNLSIRTLESFGELPTGIKLVDYNRDDRGEGEYHFFFNYKIHDYLLAAFGPNRYPIEVIVRGNQVTDLSIWLRKPNDSPDFPNLSRMISIDECISQNMTEVSMYYFQDKNIYETDLDNPMYYFPIRSEINRIEMRYFISKLGDSEMFIPSWQVDIAGRVFLFHAYTGELIQTFR